MENVHKGHRERIKEKFREQGLGSFTDIEALELLLTYALPRRETNTLAHALLDRFQSFRGVLEADRRELAGVPGIGENAAALITLIRAMNERYAHAQAARGTVLGSAAEAGRFLRPYFDYCRDEKAVLVTLDSAARVIRCHTLSVGKSDQVMLSTRDIVNLSVQDNASRAILAHNHSSGFALPSHSDSVTTARLSAALQLIGVRLTDHLIFSDDDWVSMRESGLMDGETPADGG